MKKIFALLLALSMMFSLSACGASSNADAQTPYVPEEESTPVPESEPEPEPTPEPTPGKNYVIKAVRLPVEERETWTTYNSIVSCGPVTHSAPRLVQYQYDEYGEITESVRYVPERMGKLWQEMHNSKTAVVYDNSGEIVSVTWHESGYKFGSGMTWSTDEVNYFEAGVLVRIESVYTGSMTVPEEYGPIAAETVFDYYPNGSVRSETTTTYYEVDLSGGIFLYEKPFVSVIRYSDAGRISDYQYYPEYRDPRVPSGEYRWLFDGAGNPVSMHFTPANTEDGVQQLETAMQYNDKGRMISAVKTCDGLTTNYTYEYGEDGRLAAVKREGGRGTVSSTFEYNDEGLLTAERRSDGSIRYTWTKEERGGSNVTVGTSSPDYFDLSEDRTAAIRGHELSFCDPHYYEDRSVEPRYELVISAMDLEPVYIELETETLFEEKGILVELDPEQQKTAADNQAALAPYYPPLSGYTNDVDIPSASGGERLIRIVVEDRYQFHLNLVTEFGYNEDGSLASVSEYFDPLGTIHSFCYIKGVKYHTLDQFKTDKLGRITEFNPGYGGYYYSYRYGDDADSYTFIHTRTPGGQSYETTIKLEDQRLPAWIGQMTAADGGSGKLNMDSMEFDLAGYLTRFIAFIPPYGEKTVTYYYE